MADDLIRRQDAIDAVLQEKCDEDESLVESPAECNAMIDAAVAVLKALPTADVPDRKVGEWEKKWHSFFKQELWCCSICHKFTPMRTPYCALCGARVEGGRR